MAEKKKIESRLHPESRFHGRYDLKKLQEVCPELSEFVFVNDYDSETINFHDPKAVKMLNKALLAHHYGVKNWDIPENYLCPPIPGRADYIYHIAEFLSANNYRKIPKTTCLDIGVGSSCIFPIIGVNEYDWDFIGTDVDPDALESAQNILDKNSTLKSKVELRFQDNSNSIFEGILKEGDRVDLTICNPPFHGSAQEARASSRKKIRNLTHYTNKDKTLNFGGQPNELWTEGGEVAFIQNMIRESKKVSGKCYIFSTLVSKKDHLFEIKQTLEEEKVFYHRTVNMGQGNKWSRLLLWTFMDYDEQITWKKERWNFGLKN
mgnify:CR=1 FL=1